jgi:hypothetical protein
MKFHKLIFLVDEPYFSKIIKYSFRGARLNYGDTVFILTIFIIHTNDNFFLFFKFLPMKIR